MKYFLKVLLIFLISKSSICQKVTWEKILNNNYGQFTKAYQTPDNGFIAVGTDRRITNKIYLEKYNYKGDSLWTQIIGSGSQGYGGAWVENTNDDGFIICGSDANGPNVDGYIVKTNSVGNIEWDTALGGNGLEQANCIKQTHDNGYISILRTTSLSSFNNIALVKTNSVGEIEWQKVFVANNDQYGEEVIVLMNSYLIIGSAFSDIYLMKIDLNGDTIYTRRYGSKFSDAGHSIQQTPDNGFIIGGVSYDFNNISNSIIIKIDSSSNVQWQRNYTAKFNELLYSVRNVPNKGYIFCGTTDSIKGNLERGFIRIIDLKGDVMTEKFYRALPYFTEINSVENTKDNGFILCGVTQSFGGRPQMYIAKTDSVGDITPVGISNYSQIIPIKFHLYQNLPNPFNPSTRIKFDINKKTLVNLTIYDINGKELITLLNEILISGSYEISFQTEQLSLSSGVYFYRLTTPDNISTKKMLYLK